MVSFGFVALRCVDLERTRGFYELLGLRFETEQHGAGPPHLATDVGGVVVELYPAPSADGCADPLTIGLTAPDLDGIEQHLQAAGHHVERVDGGTTIAATDPDGRRVRISPSDRTPG